MGPERVFLLQLMATLSSSSKYILVRIEEEEAATEVPSEARNGRKAAFRSLIAPSSSGVAPALDAAGGGGGGGGQCGRKTGTGMSFHIVGGTESAANEWPCETYSDTVIQMCAVFMRCCHLSVPECRTIRSSAQKASTARSTTQTSSPSLQAAKSCFSQSLSIKPSRIRTVFQGRFPCWTRPAAPSSAPDLWWRRTLSLLRRTVSRTGSRQTSPSWPGTTT